MAICEYTDYDSVQHITKTNQSRRLVGTFNQDIDTSSLGWQLGINDMSPTASEYYRNINIESNTYEQLQLEHSSRNHMYIHPLKHPPIDGIDYDYWQPGVGQGKDLRFKSTVVADIGSEFPVYVPTVKPGYYSIGAYEYYLYSDYSVVNYHDPTADQSDSGVNYSEMVLSGLASMSAPVTARLYKRNDCGAPLIYHDYKHVEAFTGELSSGTRLSTVDGSDDTVWANVDSRFTKEFRLSTTDLDTDTVYTLTYNQQADKTFALPADFDSEPAYVDSDLACYLDCLGMTVGRACETFYTTYLPFIFDSAADVRIFIYDPAQPDADIREEWDPVTSLDYSQPDDTDVLVDKDLGTITFGGRKADDNILAAGIDNSVTTIPLVDASKFALRGTVRIYNIADPATVEDITYAGKDGNNLINATRGANSTTPAAWAVSDIVVDLQKGAIPSPNNMVCVEYVAIPRIEYEIVSQLTNHSVTIHDVDLNPIRNSESEGLLYVYRCPTDVASIVMTVLNKPVSRQDGTAYGPVYVGVDYATIRICAFNAYDIPVPNAEIHIRLDGVGSIAGSSDGIFYTGVDGCIILRYQAPTNPEELGTYATAGYAVSSDTALEFDTNAHFNGLDTEDIYLYQVTKDAPFIGTVGYSGTAEKLEDSIYFTPTARRCVTCYSDLESGFFNGGILYFTDSAGYVHYREIKYFTEATTVNSIFLGTVTTTDHVVNNLRAMAFHFEAIIPGASTAVSWRAVQKDATPWDANTLNGRKSIVYNLTDKTGLTHPSMSLSKVYGPTRPDSVTSDRTLLYAGTLALPDPIDNDEVLGAYWSVSPRTVRIRAYTEDNLCDSGIILSEEVKLFIDLPPSMKGVYVAETQSVPYGFRLISETFDAASVLNAATFLTINSVGRYDSTTPSGPYIGMPATSGGDPVLSTDAWSGPAVLQNRITIT